MDGGNVFKMEDHGLGQHGGLHQVAMRDDGRRERRRLLVLVGVCVAFDGGLVIPAEGVGGCWRCVRTTGERK